MVTDRRSGPNDRRSLEIDRRSLLLGSLAMLPVGASRNAFAQTGNADAGALDAAFVSAAKKADGSFAVVLLSADGRLVREVALSARGHDIALHRASGSAVVFARRPGTFAVAFALDGRRNPEILTAVAGRHFYGHGAFSADGRLLYVSENDIANARGVVGQYDVAAGFKRIGEFSSYGIGPHEIILLPDGKTLAIANGGIDTVPESGRENLNLDAMAPSLVLVDATTGALIANHTLDAGLHRLSIRHIAADVSGTVWFGGQWEGDIAATPELIGRAGRDSALRLIAPQAALGSSLKGYIGSMAASADGRIIAASAPKAGRILYIDAATGEVRAQSDLKDGCGIAGDHDDVFAVTSGLGAFRHEVPGRAIIAEAALADLAFDNHLRKLG